VKYLVKIKYIGTAYCGFQCQKNAVAIQNVLTEAAESTFGCKTLVTGCSRTDAGVHALGFCATLEPERESTIPPGRLHRAMNRYLPSDIAVVGACAVGDDFHPRYSVIGKNYIYKIHDGACEDPFLRGRTMRYGKVIDERGLLKMKAAAEHFVGKHDFCTFMATGSKVVDTVRSVTDARVYRDDDGCVVFSVSADGFLYNMVRIMAGTLIDVAEGKTKPSDIPCIIAARDRKRAGVTAPPEGLYLNEVFYGEELDFECL